MSRFWRVDKALEDSEGLRRTEFHCNPSLMCSRGSVLIPGSSAPTNDAIFKTFSSGRTEVPLPTSRVYLRSRASLTRGQELATPGSIGGQNLLPGDHLRPVREYMSVALMLHRSSDFSPQVQQLVDEHAEHIDEAGSVVAGARNPPVMYHAPVLGHPRAIAKPRFGDTSGGA